MATAADVNTYVDAAIIAIGQADWATAATKLRQAWAALVGIPDSELKDDTSLRYDRSAIKDLIRDVGRQQGTTLGLQHTEITYARAEES